MGQSGGNVNAPKHRSIKIRTRCRGRWHVTENCPSAPHLKGKTGQKWLKTADLGWSTPLNVQTRWVEMQISTVWRKRRETGSRAVAEQWQFHHFQLFPSGSSWMSVRRRNAGLFGWRGEDPMLHTSWAITDTTTPNWAWRSKKIWDSNKKEESFNNFKYIHVEKKYKRLKENTPLSH